MLIRSTGPGEGDASLLNLQLTTITRPMIEENTLETVADPEEPSIEEVLGDQISAEEQRRLEWAGIQTVSQLVDAHRHSGDHAIGRVSNLPVNRLRAALARASRPQVSRIAPAVPVARGTAPPRLSIRGRNLIADRTPRVRIDGHDADVVEARNNELVVAGARGPAADRAQPAAAAGLDGHARHQPHRGH